MSILTKSPITADTIDTAAMSFLDPLDAIFQLKFKALFAHRHFRHQQFSQSNLVSDDQPGHLNAQIQDPNLINPWGVAFSPTGPFWVNNNHTGVATVYSVDPKTNATAAFPPASPLIVTIAPPQDVSGVTTASPTGIVFNTIPTASW